MIPFQEWNRRCLSNQFTRPYRGPRRGSNESGKGINFKADQIDIWLNWGRERARKVFTVIIFAT
jgi:hypothetical protein